MSFKFEISGYKPMGNVNEIKESKDIDRCNQYIELADWSLKNIDKDIKAMEEAIDKLIELKKEIELNKKSIQEETNNVVEIKESEEYRIIVEREKEFVETWSRKEKTIVKVSLTKNKIKEVYFSNGEVNKSNKMCGGATQTVLCSSFDWKDRKEAMSLANVWSKNHNNAKIIKAF